MRRRDLLRLLGLGGAALLASPLAGDVGASAPLLASEGEDTGGTSATDSGDSERPDVRLGLFLLDSPTEEQAEAVRLGLDTCDYPMHRLLLAREYPYEWMKPVPPFPVSFDDRYSPYGAYDRRRARIHLAPGRTVQATARTFLRELAHLVDDVALLNEDRHDLHDLFHGGDPQEDAWWEGDYHNDKAGEAFMYAFCTAFAPWAGRSSYGPHDTSDADGIREIVLRREIVAFDDTQGTTHEDAIEWAAGEGLIEGEGGSFEPNGYLTRGQMATVLKRFHDRFPA